MQDAAKNAGGAFTGFMGMNMAQQGGANAAQLFQMGAQQAAPVQPSASTWKCACGATATGKFCPECGAKKPEDGWECSCGAMVTGKFCPECGAKKPEDGWKCSCGAMVMGKFCPECGAKKPEDGWKCSCGAMVTGKFCPECGAKRPSGAPVYQCDKCGWKPADPAHPPKFCPECGDPFDESDRA